MIRKGLRDKNIYIIIVHSYLSKDVTNSILLVWRNIGTTSFGVLGNYNYERRGILNANQ